MLFNNFFRLLIKVLVAKIQPDEVVRWCADGEFLAIFLRPVFSASRVQHISDMHSKFTPRPHHVLNLVDIKAPTAENRQGKEERRRKKKEETTAAKHDGLSYWAVIMKYDSGLFTTTPKVHSKC